MKEVMMSKLVSWDLNKKNEHPHDKVARETRIAIQKFLEKGGVIEEVKITSSSSSIIGTKAGILSDPYENDSIEDI
jgi:hypothetical protein